MVDPADEDDVTKTIRLGETWFLDQATGEDPFLTKKGILGDGFGSAPLEIE